MQLKFTKGMRALRRSEFSYIRRHGKSFYGNACAIDVAPIRSRFKVLDPCSTPSKLALSVSKKMGNSPQRAQFKRRVREVFRHLHMRLIGPVYIHIRPINHLSKMPTVDAIASDLENFAPMRMPHIILRHKRENKKKCSLTPLEKRPDCLFIPYPNASSIPSAPLSPFTKEKSLLSSSYLKEKGYGVLNPNAPPLTREDKEHIKGLILIDSIWRYAPKMHSYIDPGHELPAFSLPGEIETAYPRRQDQTSGLASIEALYTASGILGWRNEADLDDYYWKEDFLNKNLEIISNPQLEHTH